MSYLAVRLPYRYQVSPVRSSEGRFAAQVRLRARSHLAPQVCLRTRSQIETLRIRCHPRLPDLHSSWPDMTNIV